jgi:fructose-1,6-bisphosphatase I
MSKSLVQFIIEEQRAIPGVSGNFTGLISDVIIACKLPQLTESPPDI